MEYLQTIFQDNSLTVNKFIERKKRKPIPERETLAQDKAIKIYLAHHAKPDGTISKNTKRAAIASAHKILLFLEKPITNHIISDLIATKKANPSDTTLEENLSIYKTIQTEKSRLIYISYFLGIFRKNYAPLQMTIHISSNHRTQPISEPILLAIRNDQELTQTHQDIIDLMSHGAERISALTKLPIKNVRLIENTNYAILEIPPNLSKTGIPHPSIIPKKLAEKLLERAINNNYQVLIPNSESLFKTITKLAERKYHVKLLFQTGPPTNLIVNPPPRCGVDSIKLIAKHLKDNQKSRAKESSKKILEVANKLSQTSQEYQQSNS